MESSIVTNTNIVPKTALTPFVSYEKLFDGEENSVHRKKLYAQQEELGRLT